MTRYGTSYFVSYKAACEYYKIYGRNTVDHALREGEIHIGKPRIIEGERLVIIDDGTRYAIEEAEPHDPDGGFSPAEAMDYGIELAKKVEGEVKRAKG